MFYGQGETSWGVGCGKGRNKCAVAKVVISCPKTASIPVGDYLHADQRA